jgi:hypothetical protein
MKSFLLFCALFGAVLVSYSQNYTFGSAGDCKLPEGFNLSQGAKVGPYKNPNNACADDCGIITPGVGGNNPANITFPPQQVAGSKAQICFDIFAFEANLKCENNVVFPCNGAGITVIAYIVAADYNKSGAPADGEYFGKSTPRIILKNERVCVDVFFSIGMNTGGDYRIFLDFSAPDNCQQSGIKYVIDNIGVAYTDESPLPVSLKSFNANRNKNNVQLKWETSTEQNVKGYNVQRNAGKSWETVSFVPSNANDGNSSSNQSYVYNEINNMNGITQYRIQMVEMNGASKSSEIRTVRGEGQVSKLTVYPNPSYNGKINVVFDDVQTHRNVFVNDMSGKLIKQWKTVSNNNLQIDNLLPGMYTIKVVDNTSGSQTIEKLIVNKR